MYIAFFPDKKSLENYKVLYLLLLTLISLFHSQLSIERQAMQSYSEPCSFSGQRCAVHCKEHRSNKKEIVRQKRGLTVLTIVFCLQLVLSVSLQCWSVVIFRSLDFCLAWFQITEGEALSKFLGIKFCHTEVWYSDILTWPTDVEIGSLQWMARFRNALWFHT